MEIFEFSAINSCRKVSVKPFKAALDGAYSLLQAAVMPVTPVMELI